MRSYYRVECNEAKRPENSFDFDGIGNPAARRKPPIVSRGAVLFSLDERL